MNVDPAVMTPEPKASPSRWLLPVGAALCVLGALTVLLAAGLPERADSSAVEIEGLSFAPEPGQLAPPFSAQTPNGETVSLLAPRGKPVILNFWATWCGPCAAEMPELQRVYDVYGDQVALVGVNTGESAQVVDAWAQARGLTFPLVLDEAREIAALYQLRGQPTTFLISPEGRIVDIIYGPTTFEGLSLALTSFLTA